jgi:PAS domain S-box-containing protein
MSPWLEHSKPVHREADHTIVVVEDERTEAEDVRRKLESWGYRVQAVVASGEEAIRTAEAVHPDLILMDIDLKGNMDGVEAARLIKARWNIPVIYAAAFTNPVTLRRAQLAEPSGLVGKPYDDHEMRYAIATALAKRAMEREVAEVEDRYRRLMAMSSDLVLLLNHGRIINANVAAQKALGYPLNELLRFDLLDFNAPDSAPTLSLVLEEIEGGIAHSGIETYVRTRTGSRLTVALSGETCLLNGESVVQIVMQDLTEFLFAEEEAVRFSEELFAAKADADESRYLLRQKLTEQPQSPAGVPLRATG